VICTQGLSDVIAVLAGRYCSEQMPGLGKQWQEAKPNVW
jgi:hypothetical protein